MLGDSGPSDAEDENMPVRLEETEKRKPAIVRFRARTTRLSSVCASPDTQRDRAVSVPEGFRQPYALLATRDTHDAEYTSGRVSRKYKVCFLQFFGAIYQFMDFLPLYFVTTDDVNKLPRVAINTLGYSGSTFVSERRYVSSTKRVDGLVCYCYGCA